MEKELDVWSLIVNNEFEKACKVADEEYKKDAANILDLRNKVYALFHLKRYEDVISLCKKLIDYRNGETDADFVHLGIANWILKNTDEAIKAWQLAQSSIYKDASGGIGTQVFLYFAGVRTKQDSLKTGAIKAIKKLLKSKRATNWPGPVGHYLLNEITETELSAYVATVPILKERQLCQAHFVIAVKKLEAGDENGYYKKLGDCVSYGSKSYLEQMYYLAKGELELMK